MFPSVLHLLSSTVSCSNREPLSCSASEQEGMRDVYLCDAVEHSDPRFSRVKDSLGRGGVVGGGQGERKASARNGRKIIRKGRDRRRWGGSLFHAREMAITTAQNRQVI